MTEINQNQMLPMGTILGGRYRIIQFLASGGFGNTYLAQHVQLNTIVAIKEFFMYGVNNRSYDGTTVEVSNMENLNLFEEQIDKFRREARRICELSNDHIIHVFDLFDANETSYYVMDYIQGQSLAETIRQHPLSEKATLDVASQVLDALETMHNSGLFHLDVKPGNIMIDDKGHCTLIDFGASKQLNPSQRSVSFSTMPYTPGFAPIEQLGQQRKSIGPWTDFFALGATLYNLVTAQLPPEVDASDITPDGRQFPYPTHVSTTLRKAISAMMNPIPSFRPQTVNDVRALLSQKQQTPPPHAYTSQPKVDPQTVREKTIRVVIGGDGNNSLLPRIRINLGNKLLPLSPLGTFTLPDGEITISQNIRPTFIGDDFILTHFNYDGANTLRIQLKRRQEAAAVVMEEDEEEPSKPFPLVKVLAAAGIIGLAIIGIWAWIDSSSIDKLTEQANNGDAAAQYELGKIYKLGEKRKKNLYEAVEWFEKSANQGNADAQYELATYYDYDAMPPNKEKALEWYKKAAQGGHHEAQNHLYLELQKSANEAERLEAVEWLKKAAEQGDKYAQFNLGLEYDNGEVIPQDYKEAVKWYKKAADQGLGQAYYNLGVCYQNGKGVVQSQWEANECFKKARKNGFNIVYY